MDDMRLPQVLPISGKSWTEELPEGAVEQSSGSFGYDFGQKVLNIKIMGGWENLRLAIKYIVGYSEVLPRFNPLNVSAQGPFTLKRYLPAKHPQFPGMRATKILSVTGKGTDKRGPVRSLNGTGGVYEFIYMSVLFEIPKYPMLTEEEITDVVDGRYPEYRRFTLFEYEDNFETIARKGVVWNAVNANARGISPHFTGDRFVRQPKGVLKVTTYDVAEDYIKLGRLIPVNHTTRNSTVNSRTFPLFGFRDQNQAGNVLVGFPPGTLLKAPTKITSHTQNHPSVLRGEISSTFFPRTVDIENSFFHFDPPTDDTTTVNLSAAVYGPGSATTLVRGHQLAPLPMPTSSLTGYAFYTWVNDAADWSPFTTYSPTGKRHAAIRNGVYYACIAAHTNVVPPNAAFWTPGIQNPNALLYPYSDYEELYKAVRSS